VWSEPDRESDDRNGAACERCPGTVTTTLGSPGVLTTGTVTGGHTYAQPGNYTITITVNDDGGGSGSATTSAQVIISNVTKFTVVDQSAHAFFRWIAGIITYTGGWAMITKAL
jgi:PKD repeat protein